MARRVGFHIYSVRVKKRYHKELENCRTSEMSMISLRSFSEKCATQLMRRAMTKKWKSSML